MLELFKQDWREVWGDTKVPASGSVYTKPEIVELILDLAGYDPIGKRLTEFRLLEPACGDGAFVSAIVNRLIQSEFQHGGEAINWFHPAWEGALRAVDISETALAATRQLMREMLALKGCPPARAVALAEAWTCQTDFLLHDWGAAQFDFVVGNPPYVRLEDLPPHILKHYRDNFRTATDRADLYIPFLECGLTLLSPRGALAFICANRFAKNQYGAALRQFMSEHYHVRHYINLEHTQPFLSTVSAYPAIVVVDRHQGEPTHAATISDLNEATLETVRTGRGKALHSSMFRTWYPGGAPWVSTCPRQQADLQELERNFPTLEASAPGTKIGIGIATGADRVFVLPRQREDIEPSRQLPLLMAADVRSDTLAWSGHWLLNPFADRDDGSLANLADYPKLQRYLTLHEALLKGRHCAKQRPLAWYRTIDRLWLQLVKTPKLLLPDIQSGGVVGYDPGGYYPHHNVYWITSESWNLRALQAILRSSQVTSQLRAHSVAMRGGSLRYQAQNLRQLRLPALAAINDALLSELAHAATAADQAGLDEIVGRAFRLAPPGRR